MNAINWGAESDRRACAHHEAGHAVVALALKLPLWYATIKPDDRRNLGEVRLAPNWQSKTDLHQTAIYQLAGAAAECRYRGREVMPPGAARDMENVQMILALQSDDPRVQQRLLDGYWVLAKARVLLHWSWIEAVAHGLLKTNELTVSRIRALEPK